MSDEDVCVDCGSDLGFGPCACGLYDPPQVKKFPGPSKVKFHGSMRIMSERKNAAKLAAK
jgi:hypothetical protein